MPLSEQLLYLAHYWSIVYKGVPTSATAAGWWSYCGKIDSEGDNKMSVMLQNVRHCTHVLQLAEKFTDLIPCLSHCFSLVVSSSIIEITLNYPVMCVNNILFKLYV